MKRLLLTLTLIALLTLPVFAADDLTGSDFEIGSVLTNTIGWQGFIDSVVGITEISEVPNLSKDKTTDSIEIQGGGFSNLQGSVSANASASLQELASDDALEAKVQDIPLCYPNPFRQNSQTYLQYTLNKAAEIQIQVYDMLANRILDKVYPRGVAGGYKDRNIVKIDDVNGNKLSVGVYFIFIMHDQKVLARTKVAVIP